MHENLLFCITLSKGINHFTLTCQCSEKDDLYVSFRAAPKIHKAQHKTKWLSDQE